MKHRHRKIEIKRNPIDKAVEYLNPRRAAQRYRARMFLAMADAYTGASKSLRSMYGFNPIEADADEWLRYDRQTLINRSHALTRNNAIVSGIFNANCTNIIGIGLKLQSRVDGDYLGLSDEKAEALETQIEREFRLWAESLECDIYRTNNFYAQQELSMRQYFTAGESFALMPYLERGQVPYGLKIQIIEPERVCNENYGIDGLQKDGTYLYDGVIKDKYGAPSKYNIASDYPANRGKKTITWKSIDAFNNSTGLQNILHIFKQLRPGQTRGVPYLAPVMEPLHNLGKYSKAELDAAVVSSLFTVFVKSETGDADINIGEPISETGAKASDDDIKLAPGSVVGLAPGEDISTANPGRPNTNFDPFVMSILRQIGIALEIPYEVLIKHFTSSYSAARAALLDSWKFYKSRRQWFAVAFCQPIFEAFMYEAVSRRRISAPGFFNDPLIRKAYCGAEWVGPAPGHIDPLKEADAIEKRLTLGITTQETETSEYNGGQFDRNMKQIKKEIAIKRDVGLIPNSPQSPAPNPSQAPAAPTKNYPSDGGNQ